MNGLRLAVLLGILLVMELAWSDSRADPETAVTMLEAQGKHFNQPQVVKTANNVFTAVGYHGATTSMIVGEDGVIIVDTQMGPASAANAFAALREHSDKPVKAIIYTHSHGDHTGGASAFVGDDNPEIYATDAFGSSYNPLGDVQPIVMKRGARQFGRSLPPEEATNRGVAPAKTIDRDRGKGFLPPTLRVSGGSHKTTITGVALEMFSGPGETDDALFVWLPREKVLFAGDNFYHAFPNLYAIRGTGYRDVRKWSDSVAYMATFKPNHLIGGHTLPISGESAVQALLDYSAAIRSVYDQTVAGINQGKSPDMIAHEVELPAEYRAQPYLIEFYGSVAHASRAIFTGLLGWYDGNPTTLSKLHPRDEAEKIAKLVGGAVELQNKMLQALGNNEYQWAMQLADHLKWLDEQYVKIARDTKIEALRGLAAQEYNAPNRNYYLTYARELETGGLEEIWF